MTEETEEKMENWQARAENAEAALASANIQNEERLIRAELKSEAIRAGMIDLDGLKLLDLADIHLNQNGDVTDADAIFNKLKRTKPWLFGAMKSSSAAVNAPRPEPPKARHANELSHEEWLAARSALTRRK